MSRDRKDRQQGDAPFVEIRQGIDGLIGTLGEVFSEISDRLETGEAREVRKTFEWDTGKGPVRAEAGVRMRFADAGQGAASTSRPMTQPANPDRRTPNKPFKAPEPRPIDFEIVETDGTWRLTADIPGVDDTELFLCEDGGELVIETTGDRKYRVVCPLPDGQTVEGLNVSLRNGILEISSHTDGPER